MSGFDNEESAAIAAATDEPLDEVLYRNFGFRGFRYPQESVIQQILSGRDVMVVMPTGGGKSLCYQLPALLLPGVTLIVSPLIALMKDQVDALQAKGIAAALVNSSQTQGEQTEVLNQLRKGAIRLLYVAPERLRNQRFLSILSSCTVSLLAIDEAHCLSQWGHDFRPDYLRIAEALKVLPRPTVAAFTATATPEVRDDILRHLGMRDPDVTVAGFERPNLAFRVSNVSSDTEKVDRIMELLRQHATGIIYCATRKSTEYVSHALQQAGIKAGFYHGGLTPTERDQVQNAFISGGLPVVVATNAFGMGIDRSDIRLVVHYEMPGSVEAYYQEAGRAGRDGAPASCEMLFSYADKRVQDFFIEGGNPEEALIRYVYKVLLQHASEGNEILLSMDVLTEMIKTDLGRINPMAVSSALSILNRMGAVERFDVPGQRIRGTRIPNPDLKPRQLKIDGAALVEKKRRDERKLQAVIQYAYSQDCRQQWVLRYFGETSQTDCGNCDQCHDGPINTAVDSGDSNAKLPTAAITCRPPQPHEHDLVLKILSGVARACRRVGNDEWKPFFGRSSIILSLRGSKSARIVEGPLGRVSTYGILKGHPQKEIEALFNEMERARLLETVVGDYPLLALSRLGSQVMRGKESYQLHWPETIPAKAVAPVSQGPTGSPPDEDLLRKLKAKRSQLAQMRKVPTYCIAPNKVLEALATLQPTTIEQALTIPGIGEKNGRTIIPAFLRLIAGHTGNGDSEAADPW